MSVYRLSQLAARKQVADAAPAVPAGLAAKAPSEEAPPSYMEAVTAFIPTEIIGGYIAILGIFQPKDETVKWIILLAVGVLLLALLYINYLLQLKKSPPAPPEQDSAAPDTKAPKKKALVASMALAFIAYLIWAAALPDSPFQGLAESAQKVAAGAIIVFAMIAPKLGELFGIVAIKKE